MSDALVNRSTELSTLDFAPFQSAEAIDASVADAEGVWRGIYVGSAGGNLKVRLARDSDAEAVTFLLLPIGFYDLAITKVFHVGTTSTGLIGLK